MKFRRAPPPFGKDRGKCPSPTCWSAISKLYGGEIALVEINPEIQEKQRVTWKEYELIQPTSTVPYRREITWSVFDEKANRVANMLLCRGHEEGAEGGYPADELPGVAAHLFRHSEGRSHRRPSELPLHRPRRSSTASSWPTWMCCSSARSSSAGWRTWRPPCPGAACSSLWERTAPPLPRTTTRATANCSSVAP